MGCFASTNNTLSSNTNSSASTSNYTNPMTQQFAAQQGQNIQSMWNTANTPVYGQTQIAQNLQGLNQLANSSINSLKSSLARSGGLQGGGQAQGVSNILQNKGNAAFNFTSGIPLMNYQAQMQGDQAAAGAGNSFLAQSPRSGTQQGMSMGSSQQTMNPSVVSDIGQIAGIAGAVAGDAMGLPGLGGDDSDDSDVSPEATQNINAQAATYGATPSTMANPTPSWGGYSSGQGNFMSNPFNLDYNPQGNEGYNIGNNNSNLWQSP